MRDLVCIWKIFIVQRYMQSTHTYVTESGLITIAYTLAVESVPIPRRTFMIVLIRFYLRTSKWQYVFRSAELLLLRFTHRGARAYKHQTLMKYTICYDVLTADMYFDPSE